MDGWCVCARVGVCVRACVCTTHLYPWGVKMHFESCWHGFNSGAQKSSFSSHSSPGKTDAPKRSFLFFCRERKQQFRRTDLSKVLLSVSERLLSTCNSAWLLVASPLALHALVLARWRQMAHSWPGCSVVWLMISPQRLVLMVFLYYSHIPKGPNWWVAGE